MPKKEDNIMDELITQDQKPEYEVGFGKPPKKNQYTKGQSGNRRGRPKGSRNKRTLWEEELEILVPIKEGSKQSLITMENVIWKQAVKKAASGDYRFFQGLLPLLLQRNAAAETEIPLPMNQELIELMEVVAKRMNEIEQSEKDKEIKGEENEKTTDSESETGK